MTAAQLGQSSLANASSLVLLQLFSRAFTFGLNQALVRLATPRTFGTAAIQFELLLSTILFLSREGVRNALLRSSAKNKKGSNRALVENISLIPVFLGVPVSGLTALIYVRYASQATASQPHFHLSVAIYAVAAVLELLSEPLYIRAQNELRLGVRVRAEGVAVVSKSVVAFLILALAAGEWALMAFAVGQAAYGFSLLVVFLGVYRNDISYIPKRVQTRLHENISTSYFDAELLNLSMAMTGQSIVKHFLTEGDKFLVSRLSPLEDQGGYAIASNYGSLVARIVFQPIEETSRLYFSKSLSSSSTPKEAVVKDEDDDKTCSKQTASKILSSLLLLFTHLLLLLVTFGPPYLPIATTLLLPPRFQNTSAPSILRSYVFYIPMMAFNGVLEAFFASTSTPLELKRQSRWMMIFSIIFVLAAYLFNRLGFGDSGFVYANVLNLFLRVVYCWTFARRYFVDSGVDFELSAAIPPRGVIGAFSWSYLVTRWSWKVYEHLPPRLLSQRNHIAVGVACVGICLGACMLLERKLWRELAQVLRRR